MNPSSMLDAVWSAYEQTQDETLSAGAAESSWEQRSQLLSPCRADAHVE